jgi:hypothetical protein
MAYKKKKIFKMLLVLPVLFIVMFGVYIYKLHALALEGNKIFEQRCLKVNPHLISYKNSFLKFAGCINDPEKCSNEDVKNFWNGYISEMRAYVTEEDKWLEVEKKYINRWDFKLIAPWYVKEVSIYQLEMYRGYRDEAFYILKQYDNKKTDQELMAKVYEARERRNKYVDLNDNLFEKIWSIRDWRKIFANMPVPAGCTDENTIIPETSGAINLEEKPATPVPTIVPFNPDLAG